MSDLDIKLLETVTKDLTWLSTEWNQDIDNDSLRRASPILRRLLIDRVLQKAARMWKKQIQIMAPLVCLPETFGNLRDIEFYACGGAKYKGMIVRSSSLMYSNKPISQQEITKFHEAMKASVGKSPVKISVFLKRPSFVIKGTVVNHEEVIKYVANKLGGVHYDSQRRINLLEHKYALMDKVHDRVKLAGKNAIYYEFLSIGRVVINSRDVQELREELKAFCKNAK